MAFAYPKLRTPSCSANLASFIVELSFDEIPNHIVEKTKDTVLDTLGCAIAGATSDATSAALALVDELGGKPESTIIGSKKKTSCANAAFVNGIMAKCFDFDGPQIGGHNSPILVPLALALAERDKLSGREAIEAMVAGVEVMGRVAKALGPEHQVPHGFHTTSTCGVFGATAAAGKLLKLDKEKMTQALGIAGSCVGGTESYLQEGSWTNSFHCGKPAFNGIVCAILARNGFTGPKWIFEGIDGILQTYSPRGTTDPSMLTDGLRTKWYSGERFIGYKRYASCGSMHSCLDAFETLMTEKRIDPEEIVEVTSCSGFSNYKYNCTPPWRKVAPSSIVEGIFSMPFCMGILAYRKRLTVAQWLERGILEDEKIRSLARKVNCLVKYDSELHSVVRVDIRTTDGVVHSTSGTFRRPFTVQEFEAKFAMNNSVTGLLSRDGVEEMKKLLRRLDTLPDVDRIMTLLRIQD